MDDLEFGLDLLFGRYSGWIDLRAIPKDKTKKPETTAYGFELDGPDELAIAAAYIKNWIEHVSPTGVYNFYMGRNLRNERNGRDSTNVDYCGALSFDIDAIRSVPDAPASDGELAATLLEAKKALGIIGRGSILMSGNGYQIWVPLEVPIDTAGRKEWLEQGHALIEKRISKTIDETKAKLDPQHDLARVVKIPGSLATKGNGCGGRPYRHAYFLSKDNRALDNHTFLNICKEAEREAKKPSAPISVVGVPSKFWVDLNRYENLKGNYLGTSSGYPSQSERDISLVSSLSKLRYSAEEAAAILRSSPASKAKEREDYIQLTCNKVFNKE